MISAFCLSSKYFLQDRKSNLKSVKLLSLFIYFPRYASNCSSKESKDMINKRKVIHIKETDKNEKNGSFIDFSICSYNILAQYQMKNNSYLYTHCNKEILDWSVRWNNLKNDLKILDSDVYCLQEVQFSHYYDEIEPEMNKLGYSGYFSPKTGYKQDGCAVFVKNSVFTLESPDNTMTVNYHYSDIRVLRTDNVGQIIKLNLKQSPQTSICIANTHLFFNPNSGEVKLAELCVLFAELDRISRRKSTSNNKDLCKYLPIVICGDFNAEPCSKIVDFIVNGRIDIRSLVASEISGQNETSFMRGRDYDKKLSVDELPPRIGIRDDLRWIQLYNNDGDDSECIGKGFLTHNFNLRSVYQYKNNQKSRLVSSFTSDDTCAVDYIFFNESESDLKLELLSYLDLITSDDFSKVGGIPNKNHGSDHIPLMASFRLYYTNE